MHLALVLLSVHLPRAVASAVTTNDQSIISLFHCVIMINKAIIIIIIIIIVIVIIIIIIIRLPKNN